MNVEVFLVGNGQRKPDRPWTGQMALCSRLRLPMFVFELSSKNHTHTPTKIVDKTTLALAWCHTCAYAECAHVCVCVRVVEVGYETVEVALVYWRVLSSVSEGPFGYSLLRQSFGEGAHSNRTWLLGGERAAAAALQTYSPAGGGYLSHLVHSSGWPIPSTTTATTTHGEGHIWPYLSMCAPVWQHTLVEAQKTTFHGECKKITKLAALKCVHHMGSLETGYYSEIIWVIKWY